MEDNVRKSNEDIISEQYECFINAYSYYRKKLYYYHISALFLLLPILALLIKADLLFPEKLAWDEIDKGIKTYIENEI